MSHRHALQYQILSSCGGRKEDLGLPLNIIFQLVLRPVVLVVLRLLSLFGEVGNHLRNVTADPLSCTYLLQRISVVHGSVRQCFMSVMGSMTLDDTPP